MKNASIAVIGAGVFGITTALHLVAAGHNVTLFEQHDTILKGASTNNHWRHHIGYHYPRSKETVDEIKAATQSFEKVYKSTLVNDFVSYYAVSKEGSATTPQQFLKFCDKEKLPYEICEPPEDLIVKDKISLCIKTPEAVYDMDIFKSILEKQLHNSSVRLLLQHQIIGGSKEGIKKILNIKNKLKKYEEKFDVVICATYSNFNDFHTWFGFPKKEVQYDLMELLEIEIPGKKRFAVTIMDGPFSSLLPRGKKGTFTLGNVKYSVLKELVAKEKDSTVLTTDQVSSNRDIIMKISKELIPCLRNAKVLKSFFVTRVVKAHQKNDDARPTEITDYGNGFYSIFAGKVITCVQTAEKLTKLVQSLHFH